MVGSSNRGQRSFGCHAASL